MVNLSGASVAELTGRFEAVNSRLVEMKKNYRAEVDNLAELTKQGKNADADSPENKRLIEWRKAMTEDRHELNDVLRELQFAKATADLGSEKTESIANETESVYREHAEAAKKVYANYDEKGTISFKDLTAEEEKKFVTEDGFRLRPQMAWQSDSGDGATVVETGIQPRAIERLLAYGACYALFQKFNLPMKDFRVPIGDQTGTKAGFPGASNSMKDETYPNFANTEVTYNVAHQAWFTDLENIMFTRWTARSERRTVVPGSAGHMRLLETGMARRVNDLLTNSTADGSSEARTQVVGLKSAVPYTLLTSNAAYSSEEINAHYYKPNRAYRTGSEDDIMLVDAEVGDYRVQGQMGTRVDSLAWMMSDSCLSAITALAVTQSENNALPWWMTFEQEGDNPSRRLWLFGSPVYVNNDLGDLQGSAGSGSNLDEMVSVFGRFGYMAVREIDMFLQQYGPGDGAATYGTYKFSRVGVTCKAWDCNALSVGTVPGKCEALHAYGTKKA